MSVIEPTQITSEPFDVPARARVAVSVDDHGLSVAIILEGAPGHVQVQHAPIKINPPRPPWTEEQLRRAMQQAHDALVDSAGGAICEIEGDDE